MASDSTLERQKASSRTLPRTGTVPGADPDNLTYGRVATSKVPLDIGPARDRQVLRPGNWTLNLVAAMTGILLALFVSIHMIGNIKVYMGAESFNEYAHWLRVVGQPFLPEMGLLWVVRGVMGASVILHIWSTLLIRYRAMKLRGTRRTPLLRAGSFVSRLMLVTGLVLLVFILIHILDLTTGHMNGSFMSPTEVQSFAYENLVASFNRPLFAAIYMFSMIALASHLIHGLWLVATDLGITGRRTRLVWKAVAYLVGIAVAVINLTIPIAVLAGVVS